MPRSIHCSIDILTQVEPVTRQHRVIGTIEVWGASASDKVLIQQQLQLRACELGADAVINLRPNGDENWAAQAIVWLSEADAPPPEPEYVPPPPPPPPEEPTPIETAHAEPTGSNGSTDTSATAEETPAKGKGKGKGKRKGKRRRRR